MRFFFLILVHSLCLLPPVSSRFFSLEKNPRSIHAGLKFQSDVLPNCLLVFFSREINRTDGDLGQTWINQSTAKDSLHMTRWSLWLLKLSIPWCWKYRWYVIIQNFGVVLFSVFSVVNGFTEIKKTPKWEKYMDRSRQHPRTPKLKRKPNAPRSVATEILTHRKFVKLQYLFLRLPFVWQQDRQSLRSPQASYDRRGHRNCFPTRPAQAFPKK